jgi:hypothetical protein
MAQQEIDTSQNHPDSLLTAGVGIGGRQVKMLLQAGLVEGQMTG